MPVHSPTYVDRSKRRIVAGFCILALAAMAWLWLPDLSGRDLTAAPAPTALHGPYSTTFPHAKIHFPTEASR